MAEPKQPRAQKKPGNLKPPNHAAIARHSAAADKLIEKLPKNKSLKPPARALPVLVLVLIFFLAYTSHSMFVKNDQTLPHSIVAASAFPVYFPQPLPDGFKVNKLATKQSNDGHLLFYTLTDKTGIKTVSVSLQSIPPGFDPTEHLVSSIKGVSVSPGTLYDDSSDATTKLIIMPKDRTSLIFITSRYSDHDFLQIVINNLKPLKS
jgi:hypothetical protein